MKKTFTHLLVVLLSFLATTAGAQQSSLTSGHVYTFANYSRSGYSLSASSINDVNTAATDNSLNSQLWYVEVSGSYYTFKNLANGKYLQGAGTSTSWSLGDDATADAALFELVTVGTSYNTIRSKAQSSNGFGYMHYGSNENDVVGWSTDAEATWWTITDMNYTNDQIQEAWDLINSFVLSDETVAGYQTILDQIFSDKACTTPALSSLAAAQAVTNYSTLPTVLQTLVEKVYNEKISSSTTAWAETNSDNNAQWDNDYAKKFRVQMYEPYSIAGEITSFLRMNAHNNLDNPTGIYANASECIYIMVDDEIPEGAELYVGHIVGHGILNGYSAYTELKQGLNAVPYFANGSQLWIMYLVHTYNSEGTDDATMFPYKLSDFDPVKINIAGGNINGYYNAIGDFRASAADGSDNLWGDVDNDEDWAYYSPRVALTSSDFTILAHRQTLQFVYDSVVDNDGNTQYGIAHYLNDADGDGDNEYINVPDTPFCNSGSWSDYTGMDLDPTTNEINIMLEAWDRIMYSQHATLGLLSTSTMEKMNTMYPRWNDDGTKGDIYTYDEAGTDGKTYKEYCGVDYSEYFNHHGVALGALSGFMSAGGSACNYHYNTMGTIITNITNAGGDIWGPAHEIGHQHQGVFNVRGWTEVTNNVFSNAAIWYLGSLTSRLNGSDGSLETVLSEYYAGKSCIDYQIWAMTQAFYKLWLYYHLSGNNTQFYPRFFEMLRRDPLNATGSTATGTESLLKIYEKFCDAAGEDLTEFFRIHGFFVLLDNYAKGDYGTTVYTQTQEEVDAAIARVKAKYSKENYTVIFINDATANTGVQHDGKTARTLYDGSANAEYGSYMDIVTGADDVTAAYTAVVDTENNTITMSGGEGGLGFIVIDDETGEVLAFSNESTFKLSDEVAYLLATGKVTVSAVDGSNNLTPADVDLSAFQKTLLEALITKIEALPVDDGTYTQVGFYTKAATADLMTALAAAKAQVEAGSGYAAAYEVLYAEYSALLSAENTTVPFDPSLSYTLTNYLYTTRTMVVSGTTVYGNTGVTTTDNTAQWTFKETGTDGVYYVYNNSGVYCPTISGSTSMTVTSDESGAGTYTVDNLGNGLWAISLTPVGTNTSFHCAANDSYKIVGWDSGSNASRWYLTITTDQSSGTVAQTAELQALITKTEALADVIGEASKITLQTTDESADYHLYTNARQTSGGDASTVAGGYNLLDGNTSTYFHSRHDGDSDDGLDHYLRVDFGEGNEQSTIKFTYTTREAGDAHAHPKVIKVEGANDLSATFEEITTISSGLPDAFTSVYTSSELTNGSSYRYVRFVVTDNYASDNNKTAKSNGHYYFYMSEFDLAMDNVKVDDDYSSYVELSLMQATFEALTAAYEAIESGTDVETATTNLTTAYDNLYAAYEKAIAAKKAELATLVTETTTLINQAGEIALGADIKLQADDSGEDYYIWTNAQQPGDKVVGNLLDGSATTIFHSSWGGDATAVDENHYLAIDLGENNSIKAFNFTYQTWNSEWNYAPTGITVQGSNILDAFTDITALSKDDADNPLPDENANMTYNSSIMNEEGVSYRYLRFVVTGNNWNRDFNGYPYFIMSEFSLTAISTVVINEDYDGIVSEDLLMATYLTNDASSTMAADDFVTTVPLLEAQIEALTEAKNELYAAMQNVNKDNLNALIATAQAIYDEMAADDGTVNDDYSTSALTDENLSELLAQITAATEVSNNTLATQADVNSAQTALDEKYQVLLAIKNSNYTTRDELNTLISNLSTLLDELTEETTTETALTLQCTDESAANYIYCNAPGATNQWNGSACDNDGVAALLDVTESGDPDLTTFLHTTYYGDDYDDDLDHYLRIDLGENSLVSSFKFNYYGRQDHFYNAPTTIVIEGSNDCETFTEITTINSGLPTDNSQYNSDEIGDGNPYRYIRLMVTTTSWGSSYTYNGDDHPYWSMSSFGFTTCSTKSVASEYSSPNLPISMLVDAYSENTAATALSGTFYVTESDYNTTYESLLATYNSLLFAKSAANIPVKLTTDAADPVLYKIKINRSSTAVLQYDDSDQMVAVADETTTPYQAWYFMAGGSDDSTDDIYIYPYRHDGAANTTLHLGAASTNSAKAAVKAVASDDASYTIQNWYITFKDAVTTETTDSDGNVTTTTTVYTEEGWWNIQPEGKANYFSNNGGTIQKMGFWNDAADNGSEFQFVLDETDYSKSDVYYELLNKHTDCGGTKTAGTNIGQYTDVTDYNTAYEAATTALENASATDDDYTTALNNLTAAYEALAQNMPVEGGFYVIYSAKYSNGYVYVNNDNKMMWATSGYDATNPRAIWQFIPLEDGGYNLKSLHTGDCPDKFGYWGGKPTLSESGGKITINVKDGNTGLLLLNSTEHSMHADNNYKTIVGWSSDAEASTWYIEPVATDARESVTFAVNLTANGAADDTKAYSSLYLGYNATIPDGITASIVTEVENGQLNMVEITDGILPAKTAVILSGEAAGGQSFNYTDSEATTDVTSNILEGTLYDKVVEAGDSYNIYMLAKKNDKIAFYWAYENYNESGSKLYLATDGTLSTTFTDGSTSSHNQGGYVKCNANKSFLKVSEGSSAAAAMFSFLFGGGTTTIDEVTTDGNAEPQIIYDLQGRRVKEATAPGLYIINGEKVLIK